MKRIDFSQKVIDPRDDKPFYVKPTPETKEELSLAAAVAEGLNFYNPQNPIGGAEKIKRGEIGARIFRHQKKFGYVDLTTQEVAHLMDTTKEGPLIPMCAQIVCELLENAPEMPEPKTV